MQSEYEDDFSLAASQTGTNLTSSDIRDSGVQIEVKYFFCHCNNNYEYLWKNYFEIKYGEVLGELLLYFVMEIEMC